jgi:hypothetical protein
MEPMVQMALRDLLDYKALLVQMELLEHKVL